MPESFRILDKMSIQINIVLTAPQKHNVGSG